MRDHPARNHFVTIEKPEDRKDSQTGQVSPHWAVLIRSVPCSIEAVSGGERVRGRQMDATATSLLTMLFMDGKFEVTTKCRCRIGERVLNIVRAYDPDGRRHDLYLEVMESA